MSNAIIQCFLCKGYGPVPSYANPYPADQTFFCCPSCFKGWSAVHNPKDFHWVHPQETLLREGLWSRKTGSVYKWIFRQLTCPQCGEMHP
jgi:hypothetical protein